MEDKLLNRKVWKPDKGEYFVEVEECEKTPINTPYGNRRAVLVRVEGEPYVWFINHYNRVVERAVETQLECILANKKVGNALIKVLVREEAGRKKYELKDVKPLPESIVISIGVYVSDDEGEHYLIHSDSIPIRGEI